jgi:hypothetical protein
MTYEEFRDDINKTKGEAYDRAWFNIFMTQFPHSEDSVFKVDKIMFEGAKWIVEQQDGKATQRHRHSGDKENPVVFVPSELMEKYGIKRTTRSTEQDSEG